MKARVVAAALLLALGACDRDPDAANEAAAPPAAQTPEAAPARAQEKVLQSETVEAVFTGWDVGDYVWANLEVKGRDTSGAWVGPSPLEHFLEAHKGRPIMVRLDTVRAHLPEAGGEQDVQTIGDASIGGVTAAVWWAALPADRKQAAETQMEEVLGSGV
jgi:hypothetical protein